MRHKSWAHECDSEIANGCLCRYDDDAVQIVTTQQQSSQYNRCVAKMSVVLVETIKAVTGQRKGQEESRMFTLRLAKPPARWSGATACASLSLGASLQKQGAHRETS